VGSLNTTRTHPREILYPASGACCRRRPWDSQETLTDKESGLPLLTCPDDGDLLRDA
jgi:hypothetical protein